jgi:hypothetical protein
MQQRGDEKEAITQIEIEESTPLIPRPPPPAVNTPLMDDLRLHPGGCMRGVGLGPVHVTRTLQKHMTITKEFFSSTFIRNRHHRDVHSRGMLLQIEVPDVAQDLDQLARSMERLPRVPMKVEFTDIKKGTDNFHKTMKLGGGGFGTMYWCTLPATASKMERPMDVTVKRFTHDMQNRRYDNFLTEVTIINNLSHKNLVRKDKTLP